VLALTSPPLVQVLISLWLLVWTVAYSGVPAGTYLRMLVVPLGLVVTSLPAILINAVGHDAISLLDTDAWRGMNQPLGVWTFYISKLGLSQSLVLFTRSLAASSALFFLLLTTPFNDLIQVLRKIAVPALLLDLIVYVYGFIFTLLDIVNEIAIAQHARSGYSGWRRSFRSLGLLIGQLLARSMATYRGLTFGLAARGFQGDLRLVSCVKHRSSPRLQLEAATGCLVLAVLSIACPR
jgi:cobalt/nickel transport system permease protein